MARRSLAHALRRIEAERHGGDARLRRLQACQRPGRTGGLLRLQVPEGAVERVAGRAWRQSLQQALSGDPAFYGVACAFDLRARALRRLVVTGVGHRLAPAGVGTVRDLGNDDV